MARCIALFVPVVSMAIWYAKWKFDTRPRKEVLHAQRGHEYLIAGNWETAEIEFNEAIRLNPKYSDAYRLRGVNYANQGKYELALADFNKSVKLHPNGNAFSARAHLFYHQGLYEQAIADYTEGLQLLPNDSFAYYRRAICFRNMRNMEKASEDIEHSIELNPDQTTGVYAERGWSRFTQDNLDGAFADANRALEINPQAMLALYTLAFVYKNRRDWERAIENFTQLIERSYPRLDTIYLQRGYCYYKAGKFEASVIDNTRAIELTPDLTLAYNNRASSYAQLGELDKALSNSSEALRLDPNLVTGYASRGYTYFLLGRYAESLADFQKTTELKSDHPFAIAGQAICHSVTGNADEAARLWKSLIELDSRYNDAETLITEHQCSKAFVNEARKIIEQGSQREG
jgi:tetratricopeptide (TPR) repeat protein